MSLQTAHTVLMVEPTRFGFNEEASATNSFQNRPDENAATIQEKALEEFREFVEKLGEKKINVIVYRDLEDSQTPDSIFPNNWFSTHRSGHLHLYPMAVSNRRKERRPDIIASLIAEGFELRDYTPYEASSAFLEGTGSMIFDHDNHLIYAALSPRTNEDILEEVAMDLGYAPITFHSMGRNGELIYHTNVMMCVGQQFVAIGLDTIQHSDRRKVVDTIRSSGKEIIELSNDQVYNHFAGNMLQLQNMENERILVLSETAYQSLTEDQLEAFGRHNDAILPVSIPTIEHIGGGSARCMLAEIFFPET